MKNKIIVGLFLFIGLLGGAEYLIQTITDKEFSFSHNFRPGPYAFNKDLGMVTYKPNYKGFMNVHGSNVRVPVSLSQYGTREVSSNTSCDDCKKILIVGGISQTFGFGLRNEDTIAENMVRSADFPLKVYNLSQPGVEALRSMGMFEDYIRHEIKPDLVIVGFYNMRDLSCYAPEGTVQNSFGKYGKRTFEANHVIKNGWVVSKPDTLLGHLKLKSALFDGICKTAETINGYRIGGIAKLKRAFYQIGLIKNAPLKEGFVKPNHDFEVGAEKYISFIRSYFADMDTKIVFVMFPLLTGEKDVYKNIVDYLPKDQIVFDINREVAGTPLESEKLSDGHYNSFLAAHIGKSILNSVRKFL